MANEQWNSVLMMVNELVITTSLSYFIIVDFHHYATRKQGRKKDEEKQKARKEKERYKKKGERERERIEFLLVHVQKTFKVGPRVLLRSSSTILLLATLLRSKERIRRRNASTYILRL